VDAGFPFPGDRIVAGNYARVKVGITRRAAKTRFGAVIYRKCNKQSGYHYGQHKKLSIDSQIGSCEHKISLLLGYDFE
jgi:hypothetical protein